MSIRTVKLAALALLMFGSAACGRKDAAPADTVAVAPPPAPPPAASVSTIETGKHLGSNKRVTATDSVFGPKDTLYAAVVTANTTPTSMLIAKWTFQSGQLVDSTMQAVARTDSANPASVTEFHVVKPSGWPVGKYKVEVWLDGVSAGARDITVKK